MNIIFHLVVLIDGHKMNCHGDMKVKHAFDKRSEENITENQGK